MVTIEELRAAIEEIVKACPSSSNPVAQYLGDGDGMPSGYVFLCSAYVQLRPVPGGLFELWRGIYDFGVRFEPTTGMPLQEATAAAVEFVEGLYKTTKEDVKTRVGSVIVCSRPLIEAVNVIAVTLQGNGSRPSTSFIRLCLAPINYVVDDNGQMIMHVVEFRRLLSKLKTSK